VDLSAQRRTDMFRHAEKRDFHRMEMRVACDVEILAPGSEKPIRGRVKDLSGAGISFEVDRAFDAGTMLQLSVNPGANSLEAAALVVRCSADVASGRFEVACEFASVK
jgi:hypothetical protein